MSSVSPCRLGRGRGFVVALLLLPAFLAAICAQGARADVFVHKKTGETFEGTLGSGKIGWKREVRKADGTSVYLDLDEWTVTRSPAGVTNPRPAATLTTNKAVKGKPYGWLGVHFRNGEQAGTKGVVVDAVVPRSPAEQAGIRPGDLVTGIGPHRTRDWADLCYRIARSGPGQRVAVRLIRGGRHLSTFARIADGRRPSPAVPIYLLGSITREETVAYFASRLKHAREVDASCVVVIIDSPGGAVPLGKRICNLISDYGSVSFVSSWPTTTTTGASDRSP